jgi:hypothetical protein
MNIIGFMVQKGGFFLLWATGIVLFRKMVMR